MDGRAGFENRTWATLGTGMLASRRTGVAVSAAVVTRRSVGCDRCPGALAAVASLIHAFRPI